MNISPPSDWSVITFGVPLGFSLSALIVACLNYRRKSALKLRSQYSISSSIECTDSYVSDLALENLKDRAVTIYAIYLKLGHNYYIQIDDFNGSPLILKAYESWKKSYGPIQQYAVSMQRINMEGMFDPKIKNNIVLSTTQGKYIIKESINHWDPTHSWFYNHATASIRTRTLSIRDTLIGDRPSFAVEFTSQSGSTKIATYHKDDYKFVKFSKFKLTPESLENRANLEAFLNEQIKNGNLNCAGIVIHDLDQWKTNQKKVHKEPIDAKYINWFEYYVLARFLTFKKTRALMKENKRISAEAKVNRTTEIKTEVDYIYQD
jgi:hypothetical protein